LSAEIRKFPSFFRNIPTAFLFGLSFCIKNKKAMQSPSNHIVTSASVGIDDLSVYIPKLYLPIADLAKARNIDPDKLRHGLGLIDMAVADAHEDAATLAANAVKQLIDQNELDPRRIGRIYLGTESALDGAKPTATYIQTLQYPQAHSLLCQHNLLYTQDKRP